MKTTDKQTSEKQPRITRKTRKQERDEKKKKEKRKKKERDPMGNSHKWKDGSGRGREEM